MEEVKRITIPRWYDRHLHPRDEELLMLALPYTLRSQATGATIMGNLSSGKETSTRERTRAFRNRIISIARAYGYPDFKPRMTCYLTDDATPEEVLQGFLEGVWPLVKMYLTSPKGAGGTTNSSCAVRNIRGRYPVFEVMETYGIPLLGHFEDPQERDVFDKEIRSLEHHVIPMLRDFPRLKIVFEHVSDYRVAEFIADGPYNIFGTIAPQYLWWDYNQLFRGGMNPACFSWPILKSERHRLKLRKEVTKGKGKNRFGAGTDSAPHVESAKARLYGAPGGVFTALSAVQSYATVFDEEGALDQLGPFLSENFLHIYGMGVSTETMTLERVSYEVPEMIGEVPVFLGGETLPWRLVDR